MSRAFLLLTVALIAGIACGNIYPIPDLSVQISLIIALILVLLFLSSKNLKLLNPIILLSMFLIGILDVNLYRYPHVSENHILHYAGDKKINVEGVICENPQVFPEKTELVVFASRILCNGRYLPVSGRVLLSIREPYPFHYGDFIRFNTRLRVPRNFRNPGGFDYEKYLRFRGIFVRGYVKDATGFVVLRKERGHPLRLRLEHFRDHVRKTILEKAPGTEGMIIQAMILGDQREIPKAVMEKFNRTGTTHIIAISGFNIGMVAIFALFVAHLCLKTEYLLLRWNMAMISMLFAISVVILYTFIAGAGISVVRASIMAAVFLGAVILNRESDLYNALALAAFLILIISPYSLFDISFQLSFVAVASLIFFMPKCLVLLPEPPPNEPFSLTRVWIFHRIKKGFRIVLIFFIASLSATLGTLPLIILYFNRLSLITLAANFICVPILGVLAIPICLLIVLTVPLSTTLANGIIRISELLVQISLFFIDRLSSLPWASVYVSTPTLPEIAAFYLFLIWSGLLLKRYASPGDSKAFLQNHLLMKAIPVILILFVVIDSIHLYSKEIQQGRLSLTAVDVGQGNSILIRFPGGEKMLVDGGGFFDDSFDLGKFVLAPYLWHQRITRIDAVVLTHPHPDHLQGLLFILENFHVREVWTNGDKADTEQYHAFLRVISERGMILRTLSDSTPEIDISGVRVRVLNPEGNSQTAKTAITLHGLPDEELAKEHSPLPPPSVVKAAAPISDASNDRSLVLKLEYGERRFLLPADISESIENRLVLSGQDLGSDILIIPHHGSFHSSSLPFLRKIKPRIAVVSCGAENVFRVPHPDVLGRYEEIKANVYRTDLDGAVTITTDGQKITIDTFIPQLR